MGGELPARPSAALALGDKAFDFGPVAQHPDDHRRQRGQNQHAQLVTQRHEVGGNARIRDRGGRLRLWLESEIIT